MRITAYFAVLLAVLLCTGCAGSRETLSLQSSASESVGGENPAVTESGNTSDDTEGSTSSTSKGYASKDGEPQESPETGDTPLQATGEDGALRSETQPTIYVHICGEISHPGVYEMKSGSRVYELVNQAGGLTEAAYSRYLNQAQPLCDGEQIYIPSEKEAKADPAAYASGGISGGIGTASGTGAVNNAASGTGTMSGMTGGSSGSGTTGTTLVNINTADAAGLQTIKGIGASRAEDIIAYRNQNGSFGRIEDIMQVSGIKEGLFAKIKDQICVQ